MADGGRLTVDGFAPRISVRRLLKSHKAFDQMIPAGFGQGDLLPGDGHRSRLDLFDLFQVDDIGFVDSDQQMLVGIRKETSEVGANYFVSRFGMNNGVIAFSLQPQNILEQDADVNLLGVFDEKTIFNGSGFQGSLIPRRVDMDHCVYILGLVQTIYTNILL